MNYKEYCEKCERDHIKLYTVSELITALQQCPQDAVVATRINVNNEDYGCIHQFSDDMLSVRINEKGNRVTLQGGYIGLDLDDADSCIDPAQNVLVLEKRIKKGRQINLDDALDKYIIRRHKHYSHDRDDPNDIEGVMKDDLRFDTKWYDIQKTGNVAILQNECDPKITIRRYVPNPYYHNEIDI